MGGWIGRQTYQHPFNRLNTKGAARRNNSIPVRRYQSKWKFIVILRAFTSLMISICHAFQELANERRAFW